MDYMILESDFISKLREKVNDWLKKGYKCQGGVCVSTDETNVYYAQAMIKGSK